MKKNNQPLILGIVVIGAVLVIALALIFTRDSDETTTETPAETNTTETDNNNQQPRPTPDPQPTPDPDPQPGILPVNWDSLTSQEKLDLNPYDCASIVEIRKTDGRCDDDVLLSQVRFESLVESDGYNPVGCFQAIPETEFTADGLRNILNLSPPPNVMQPYFEELVELLEETSGLEPYEHAELLLRHQVVVKVGGSPSRWNYTHCKYDIPGLGE